MDYLLGTACAGVAACAAFSSRDLTKYVKDTYSDYVAFKGLMENSKNCTNPVTLHIHMGIVLAKTRWHQLVEYRRWRADQHNKYIAHVLDCEGDDTTKLVRYTLHNKVYTFSVKLKDDFPQIIAIRDTDGNNVKKDLIEFLGPNHDFHGIAYTPRWFGYERLTFDNGMDEITFQGDEIIIL
mgnify:CR=1 FL=1